MGNDIRRKPSAKYEMRIGLPQETEKVNHLHVPGAILVFFDTETTGLDKRKDELTGRIIKDEIVQVYGQKYFVDLAGLLHYIDSFERYVKPGVPVDPEAAAVTHITDEVLADKPTWAMVHEDVRAFFGNHVVIAHNSPFDMKMMKRMYEKMGDSFEPAAVIDTLAMSRYLYPETRHRLCDMIEFFGLQDKIEALSRGGEYHDSKTDVIGLVCLYEELLSRRSLLKFRYFVPYITTAWRWAGHCHEQTSTVFQCGKRGKITYNHTFGVWQSDDINLAEVNMLEWERNVFDFTGTETFTELKKWDQKSGKKEKTIPEPIPYAIA